MGRLDGKVIVVTGGGRGFGRAYSLGLAREGATVAIAEMNQEDAKGTQAAVEELGGRAVIYETDVQDEASILAMRDAVDRDLGGIDGLMNNAGVMPPMDLKDITKEFWDRVYDTNVWGSFVTARAISHSMRQRGGGSIVNIASSTFFNPSPGSATYISSKGAIVALTRALATALAEHGIRVNSIYPGLTATPGVLEGRPVSEDYFDSRVAKQMVKRRSQIDDVVGAAIFLLSEESAFMTGQGIPVNGGIGMV